MSRALPPRRSQGRWHASFPLRHRPTKDAVYRACGAVYIASDEDVSGDRPMSISWTLGVPLTPGLFREFSVLRGG